MNDIKKALMELSYKERGELLREIVNEHSFEAGKRGTAMIRFDIPRQLLAWNRGRSSSLAGN